MSYYNELYIGSINNYGIYKKEFLIEKNDLAE